MNIAQRQFKADRAEHFGHSASPTGPFVVSSTSFANGWIANRHHRLVASAAFHYVLTRALERMLPERAR